ncbi:Rv1733c family protein [Streptomyces sp. NPDC002172]
MRRTRRVKKLLWRWRSNPLRRRDDVVEAWVVLAVWALVVVGGTVAGLLAARAADDVFARQREEREPVRAVLLVDVPKTTSGLGTESERTPGTVTWTAPDGSARRGRTLVDTGTEAGSRVVVWQDRQGRLTTRPPSARAAAVEAGVLGTAAGCALAGVVIGAGAVARWRLEQRRLGLWDREWTTVGPRWGHKTG